MKHEAKRAGRVMFLGQNGARRMACGIRATRRARTEGLWADSYNSGRFRAFRNPWP